MSAILESKVDEHIDQLKYDKYLENEERNNMSKEKHSFHKLNDIDVSKYTEKKGRFTYLSWAYAVRELKKVCPNATWGVEKAEDGSPFFKTECGYFVHVWVDVDGVKLSQLHPVLNHKNQPIAQPNSFEINTSLQRCLAKAIALHGLGLYIFAGEDLPEEEGNNKVEQVKRNELHDKPF